MKNKSITFFSITIIFLLITSSVMSEGTNLENNTRKKLNEGYAPFWMKQIEPIKITSNAELTLFIQNHGLPGTGTQDDPYIITGFLIKQTTNLDTPAISISNTNFYLIIRNCSISTANNKGILIESASKIKVEHNYLDVYDTAIYVKDSESIVIRNNQITRANKGIIIIETDNVNVTDNFISTFYSYSYGILISSGNNLLVSGNQIGFEKIVYTNLNPEYGYVGLKVANSPNNVTIENNVIGNFQHGAELIVPINNLVFNGNKFTRSGVYFSYTDLSGFNITSFENNTIENKKIEILYSVENQSMSLPDVGQIFVVKSENLTIKDLQLATCSKSIVTVLYSININFENVYLDTDDTIVSEPISISSSSQNITIQNSHLKVSEGHEAISIVYSNNVTIKNTLIEGFSYGIISVLSDSLNLTNNVFRNNTISIILHGSENASIIGNRFTEISYASIEIKPGTTIEVLKNNVFDKTGIFVYFNTLTVSKVFYYTENNTINGKPLGVYESIDGLLITDQNLGELILINVTNVVVARNSISDGTIGINILYSENITIDSNAITNTYKGIDIFRSQNINITNNNVVNARSIGITVKSSEKLNLTKNTIINVQEGIYFNSNQNVTIQENYVYDNLEEGIYLYYVYDVTIIKNVFNNNSLDLYIGYSALIDVVNNTFYSGIDLSELSVSGGMRFRLFDNNTIKNKPLVLVQDNYTKQVIQGAGQLLLLNASNVEISSSQLTGYNGIFSVKSSNITITDSVIDDTWNGVFLYSCYNFTVSNVTIHKTSTGIRISSSINVTITNNMMYSVYKKGVSVSFSTNITVSNSEITSNNYVAYVYGSDNITLTSNVFKNATYGLYLNNPSLDVYLRNNQFLNTSLNLLISSTSNYEIYSTLKIEGNTVNGLPLLLYYNTSNINIGLGECGQAILIGVKNARISGFNGVHLKNALIIAFSSNVTIESSSFKDSYMPIFIYNSSSIIITNSTFSNNFGGIYACYSSNVNITYNEFNEFLNYAVDLFHTYVSTISYNVFTNSTDSSITMAADSGKNNLFYHNTWSDWTSPDNNNDGIVDNPYKLDGWDENHDYYPVAKISTQTSSTSGKGALGGFSLPPISEMPWWYFLILGLIVAGMTGIIISIKRRKKKPRASAKNAATAAKKAKKTKKSKS